MDDSGSVVAFWTLAALTVGSALMVVAVRNLVHAVVYLILSFVGVAGIFVLLSADFLAVAQVLIYAGAIPVLIIFAIMLTPRAARDNAETSLGLPALPLVGALLATIISIAVVTDWPEATRGGFEETTSVIGEALLSTYVLPFEIASVLLLAAMLGAIILVRED
ncbi:MAG: NADH-quinone oxidoreductase subunit J [Chloroflexi bacterium]|nr:NADH-quinone oxidoreductase subunit J [Chloroflexota bacterium]